MPWGGHKIVLQPEGKMFKQSISNAPQRQRVGLVSHILLQKDDVPGDHLAVTWVEVEPGSQQTPHRHDSEQAYIVIQGIGHMTVVEEEEKITPLDAR
jgi:mannose-6-phosphate isomerase-like protein (cupin superfamily)